MTTRTQQRDEQRARLLQISLRLFNDKGYEGSSTRLIAKEAGISSGLLFHYFPTKLALYEELVRIGFERVAIDAEAGLEDPTGFLQEQAESTLTMLTSMPQAALVFTFMSYAQLHPGISDEVDALFETHDLIQTSIPIFEAGQRAGSIRPGDPEALSIAFWSALQGIAEEIAVNPNRAVPDADWIVDIVRNRRSNDES